jgi:hypothetical protein
MKGEKRIHEESGSRNKSPNKDLLKSNCKDKNQNKKNRRETS